MRRTTLEATRFGPRVSGLVKFGVMPGGAGPAGVYCLSMLRTERQNLQKEPTISKEEKRETCCGERPCF